MVGKGKHPHAIALFSGGLDSSLAVVLMRHQGIEVTALMFQNPFSAAASEGVRTGYDPHHVAEQFGFSLKSLPLGDRFIVRVRNPRFGYGKNMNPCIDCRIFMLQEAARFMRSVDADFVVTGEVLGQRPMSQMRNTLNLIVKQADLRGLLLRPLSAGLMPPTIPEQKGLVDRDQLEAISGRSRKRQIELAGQFGLEDYTSPAAGCLLTDRGYSVRLKDLFDHEENFTDDDIALLRIGRQFRISPQLKLVIGRNESDNETLEKYLDHYACLEAVDTGSPIVLLAGQYSDEDLKLAAAITARYCRARHAPQVRVVLSRDGKQTDLVVAPATDDILDKYRIVPKQCR